MIHITEADSIAKLYQSSCFGNRDSALAPGRLAHFPDVNIYKRPNFLSSNFIGRLGRSGRSGRLYRVNGMGGKHTCVFTYVDTYRETSGTS